MKKTAPAPESAIRIRNLQKTYANGFVALKGIDLDIPRGSFFALLGPNGAGKSTTIGIVTGLVRATGGTVEVGGFDTATHPVETKMQLGVVAQEFNFGIFDTLFEIVLNQAGYYGIARSEALPIAEKNLRKLGLWEKRNDQARTLSGGMKRRLMIARALMHEPEILILDEPTAGVDIELRRGMWDFLRELNAAGVTIVLTTHYLEEAETLCDRVAIINRGEIVREGTMKSLLSTLDQESYVIETVEKPTESQMKALKTLRPILAGDGNIEITLKDTQSFDEVTGKLRDAGLTIHRLRNKANRLEELFVQLTK
jgi:ABC-2 type transport system ATP-binding protein